MDDIKGAYWAIGQVTIVMISHISTQFRVFSDKSFSVRLKMINNSLYFWLAWAVCVVDTTHGKSWGNQLHYIWRQEWLCTNVLKLCVRHCVHIHLSHRTSMGSDIKAWYGLTRNTQAMVSLNIHKNNANVSEKFSLVEIRFWKEKLIHGDFQFHFSSHVLVAFYGHVHFRWWVFISNDSDRSVNEIALIWTWLMSWIIPYKNIVVVRWCYDVT